MTATELLTAVRQAGIVLEVRGDRLHVEAPAGVLTPTLRDELTRCKAALLELLAPVTEFVYLRGGLTVPRPALELALDLERRGFRMSLDADQQFQIEPAATLTEADLTVIRRWRLHLGAIIGYTCEVLA
jgi:hypothetical protein